MPSRVQEFLADATLKAAADLETALKRLPEDKRNWSAMGSARSALDMVAECAMLNGSTMDMLKTKVFPADFDMETYAQQKQALVENPDGLLELLHTNTAVAIEKIKAVPDAELDATIAMPWGTYTVAQTAAYPYWNMSYHEGQINFIASMLGCLD